MDLAYADLWQETEDSQIVIVILFCKQDTANKPAQTMVNFDKQNSIEPFHFWQKRYRWLFFVPVLLLSPDCF